MEGTHIHTYHVWRQSIHHLIHLPVLLLELVVVTRDRELIHEEAGATSAETKSAKWIPVPSNWHYKSGIRQQGNGALNKLVGVLAAKYKINNGARRLGHNQQRETAEINKGGGLLTQSLVPFK